MTLCDEEFIIALMPCINYSAVYIYKSLIEWLKADATHEDNVIACRSRLDVRYISSLSIIN